MDDDGGDWFTDAADEPAPELAVETAAATGGTIDPGASVPGGDNADGGEAQSADEAKVEDEYLDPDKLLLFKHWIRPKFLQYKYLYDYRHNYYDDVIDFLDKRQKGVYRDIPHAQTWAERALRTYNSKINKIESFRRLVEDTKLVTKTRLSGSFHLYHSKVYINRRYSSILA